MELGNKDVLEIIEKSLFVVVLDDELPIDDSDCCWKLMCGNPSNRYGSTVYSDSKLLALACFAELVKTGLGRTTCPVRSISAQSSREGIKCTKAKESLMSYCLIYGYVLYNSVFQVPI